MNKTLGIIRVKIDDNYILHVLASDGTWHQSRDVRQSHEWLRNNRAEIYGKKVRMFSRLDIDALNEMLFKVEQYFYVLPEWRQVEVIEDSEKKGIEIEYRINVPISSIYKIIKLIEDGNTKEALKELRWISNYTCGV